MSRVINERNVECRGVTTLDAKASLAFGEIERIIASPESADSEIPRLGEVRTGRHRKGLEKANLSIISQDYQLHALNQFESALRERGAAG